MRSDNQIAGREALDKWKTQPIGGEIRPEAWGKTQDADVRGWLTLGEIHISCGRF